MITIDDLEGYLPNELLYYKQPFDKIFSHDLIKKPYLVYGNGLMCYSDDILISIFDDNVGKSVYKHTEQEKWNDVYVYIGNIYKTLMYINSDIPRPFLHIKANDIFKNYSIPLRRIHVQYITYIYNYILNTINNINKISCKI